MNEIEKKTKMGDLLDNEVQRMSSGQPNSSSLELRLNSSLNHPIKILRLFGVNIPIYQNHICEYHPHNSPPQTHQPNTNPNIIHHKRKKPSDGDSLQLQLQLGPLLSPPLPKKPKILRLFGVNIPIHDDDDQSPSSSTSSEANQGIIAVVEPQQQQQVEEEEAQPIIAVVEPQQQQQQPQEVEEEEAQPIIAVVEKQQQQVEEDDEEEEEYNPLAIVAAPIPPQLGPRLMEEHNAVRLFEKELTMSDVAPNHGRLLITGSERLMAALTEEERAKVENKGYSLRIVTKTTERDEGGVEEFTLRLTKWPGAIVLINKWNRLVRRNQLLQGDSVQGWGYRLRGEFRLVLNIIRKLN